MLSTDFKYPTQDVLDWAKFGLRNDLFLKVLVVLVPLVGRLHENSEKRKGFLK